MNRCGFDIWLRSNCGGSYIHGASSYAFYYCRTEVTHHRMQGINHAETPALGQKSVFGYRHGFLLQPDNSACLILDNWRSGGSKFDALTALPEDLMPH